MSEFLGTVADKAAQGAAMMSDDVLMLGVKMYQNHQRNQDTPRKPRIAALFRVRKPSSPFNKQEFPVVTTLAPTQDEILAKAEKQATMNVSLQKFVDDAKTPEAKAEVLINIGKFNQDLAKQEPLLADVDEELKKQVLDEWFAQGHADLKGAVLNARAGELIVPLAKIAAVSRPEEVLAKMVDDAPNDTARSHILAKIGSLTRQIVSGLETIQGEPKDRQGALVKSWLEADPGDATLRKSILDIELARLGKTAAIYGGEEGEDKPAGSVAGNAAAHVSGKLGGSQSSPGPKPVVPTAGSGEGSGSRTSNSVMSEGGGGASPNPGSGPNDTGDGATKPATLIRRRGTTGGLGNSAGAQTGGSRVTDPDGDGDGKKKKVKAEKAELIGELVKFAPDEMIEAIGALEPDDQVEELELAADHAKDLMAWSNMIDPDVLTKRDMDAEVEAWLIEDPETINLKKWTAEALATAEAIPVELANSIMGWEPMKTVRVRQPFAAAA